MVVPIPNPSKNIEYAPCKNEILASDSDSELKSTHDKISLKDTII